jgi:hypothetical protein
MINACEEAMLLHMSTDNLGRLLQEVAKEAEPIPPRTVDDYIARVKKRWADEDAETRPEVKKQAIRRQFSHIRRAVQKGNLSAVARHEKLLGDIQGVFAPIKVEATGAAGTPLVPRGALEVVDALRKLVGDGPPAAVAAADAPKAE